MKKHLLSALVLPVALLVVGCGGGESKPANPTKADTTKAAPGAPSEAPGAPKIETKK